MNYLRVYIDFMKTYRTELKNIKLIILLNFWLFIIIIFWKILLLNAVNLINNNQILVNKNIIKIEPQISETATQTLNSLDINKKIDLIYNIAVNLQNIIRVSNFFYFLLNILQFTAYVDSALKGLTKVTSVLSFFSIKFLGAQVNKMVGNQLIHKIIYLGVLNIIKKILIKSQ